tara:strand:+ start:932 stop:1612 length:681 start_codon:yes stop_codon:yes gene_type:complete
MNWDDKGFLISKTKYNENSIIAEFFTMNYGKVSGILFGATSRKIKNYLQIGNNFHVNYTFKNESKIGYFKIEIIKAQTPLYFDNKKKLLCLNTAINLVKILTADLQSNKNIYDLINNFFEILPLNNWIKEYIYWELKLLKQLGYDLELKSLVNEEKKDNKIRYYVKSQNGIKTIPNFLINHNTKDVNESDLINGLNLVSDYLDKSVFKPNNINYPNSRTDFINILK